MNNAIVTILNKKSVSTPSLPDAAETASQKISIASTEQAASVDNLAAKVSDNFSLVLFDVFCLSNKPCNVYNNIQQAAQEITESVVNVARTELADISTNQIEKTAEQSDHYVVMQLKDQDVSNATKDLSTIIETLVSDETARMNGKIRRHSFTVDRFCDVDRNVVEFLAGNAANNNQTRRLHSKDNANTYVLVDALPNSSNNMISNRNCYTRIKMVCVYFLKTNFSNLFDMFVRS